MADTSTREPLEILVEFRRQCSVLAEGYRQMRAQRDAARREARRLHRALEEVTSTAKEVKASNTAEFMVYLAERCRLAEYVWETIDRDAIGLPAAPEEGETRCMKSKR